MNYIPNPPIHDSRRPKPRPEFRTRNFSLNNAPPAYYKSESEGAPPKYQESVGEDSGVSAKSKKGRWVQIFASFLTVMIVTLVIAVVVGKIYFMKENEKDTAKSDAASNTTTTTASTASTRPSISSPQQTTTLHTVTITPSTPSTQVAARATLTLTADLNIDDAIKARQVTGVSTTTTLDCGPVSQESRLPLKQTDYLDMITYSHGDCLLAQTSFRGDENGALQYFCSVSCGHGEKDEDVSKAIVVDNWELDSG